MNFTMNRLQGTPQPNVVQRPPPPQRIMTNTTQNSNIYRANVQSNMLGRLLNGQPCASCGAK